jgi:hypothetical protein
MKIKILSLIAGLLFLSTMGMAWDEVTHSFMTDKVIGEIKIPELKDLLQRNRDEFLSGSWLTDTYQYTHNRCEVLNPHNLYIHCNAYLNYLQKEEIRQQANYEKLVALFFGSMAHTTEDFWLDNILYDYPKSIGENVTGDTFNGVISISKFGYLTKKVKPYFPFDDMYQMYKDAGLLESDYLDKVKFREHYIQLIAKQYEQLRLLKFLSFLASNQVQNKSPWMSNNIMTTTGGMLSCVNNTARYLESIWQMLHQNEVGKIVNVAYSGFSNRLGVTVAFPYAVQCADSLNITVTGSKKDTIRGEITAFNYGGTKTNLVTLVYSFKKNSTLGVHENYLISLRPKNDIHQPLDYSFKPEDSVIKTSSTITAKSWISTLGTGFFLFFICLGLAGIFWGLPGIFILRRSVKNEKSYKSALSVGIIGIFMLIGVVILLLGIYLLITKGWIVIMNV